MRQVNAAVRDKPMGKLLAPGRAANSPQHDAHLQQLFFIE
jgi:hypothetical protein